MTSVVDVVLVNYSVRDHLQTCLDSIERAAANQVIVVDNASPDDSVAVVASRYPWAKLIANKRNVGYGAAANQAIAESKAHYVFLLNSDTVLQRGAVHALCKYLDENCKAAIVGPRILDSDGTLQASCFPFPSPLDTLLENSSIATLIGRFIRRHVPVLRNLYLRTWSHDSVRIVPWIKGAALAIRREAFEAVGGFDEAFFMYFEDADLCYRLKKAGWEVHFAPVTTVVHAGGASTEQVRSQMAVQLLKSTALFYRRHNTRLSVVGMTVVLKGLMLVKCFFGACRLAFTRDVQHRRSLEERIATYKQVLRGHMLTHPS